jgi:hypothetical protein
VGFFFAEFVRFLLLGGSEGNIPGNDKFCQLQFWRWLLERERGGGMKTGRRKKEVSWGWEGRREGGLEREKRDREEKKNQTGQKTPIFSSHSTGNIGSAEIDSKTAVPLFLLR